MKKRENFFFYMKASSKNSIFLDWLDFVLERCSRSGVAKEDGGWWQLKAFSLMDNDRQSMINPVLIPTWEKYVRKGTWEIFLRSLFRFIYIYILERGRERSVSCNKSTKKKRKGNQNWEYKLF